MLFHYGNCRKEIEELKEHVRKLKVSLELEQNYIKELNKIIESDMLQLTEQKAIVDYTLLEKEKLLAEFDEYKKSHNAAVDFVAEKAAHIIFTNKEIEPPIISESKNKKKRKKNKNKALDYSPILEERVARVREREEAQS